MGIYNNPNFEYNVEIEPGNYTQSTLIEEVDENIKALSTVYTDVSFGNSGIEYSTTNAKTKMIIDIQNVFNEYNYNVSITDVLKKVLGFERIPSKIGTVISKVETIPIGSLIKLTNENNKIKLVQYTNESNILDISGSIIIDTIEITIPQMEYDNNDINSYGSNVLVTSINDETLTTRTDFLISSGIMKL